MSRRVRVSGPAKSELDTIWEFVAEEKTVEAATRLVDSLTSKFPLLGKHRAIGRRRDELESGVRSFPADNYVIYYRQRKGGIETRVSSTQSETKAGVERRSRHLSVIYPALDIIE